MAFILFTVSQDGARGPDRFSIPLVPDCETTGNKDEAVWTSCVLESGARRRWGVGVPLFTEAAGRMRRRRRRERGREDSDQEMTGGDLKLGFGICLTVPWWGPQASPQSALRGEFILLLFFFFFSFLFGSPAGYLCIRFGAAIGPERRSASH